MKKKTIITGIMMIMLMGIVSAGLVDFISNTITGTINVQGPVFYTAAQEELIMNNEPDSTTTKTINGIEEIDFIMIEDLDGIDFYKPQLEFVVKLEINNFTIPRGIELEFGYIKENGNSVRICNVQKIDITENGVVEIPCSGIVSPTDIEHFYYTIEGMGNEFLEYKIKTKESYVKITGVAPTSVPSEGGGEAD